MNPITAAGIRVYRINRLLPFGLAFAMACAPSGFTFAAGGPPATIAISADKVTTPISPLLYGLMTEEINYSYDGGLYAELIRNRTFRNNATNAIHWQLMGDASGGSISLDTAQHLNDVLPVSLKLDITKASRDNKVGVANEGYWGIPVKPNTRYRASFYAKATPGFSGPLMVSIVNAANHATVLASEQIAHISDAWRKYSIDVTTSNVPESKDNLFVISAETPGTVWFSLVSLFPPTFNNRPNGNRPDIMQLLGDMKPAFLRFPGGNYLEGNTHATRFNWKTTVGDLAQRPGHFDDAWGYWSSDGMGLLEFLEWCEDLHMEPVLAVYGGYSMRQGAVKDDNVMNGLVQDALEEIEYVVGDSSTKWGGQRSRDGHPAPFKLRFVEVGNEDNLGTGGQSYNARYARFYDAIKAKYPLLKVISTVPSGDQRWRVTSRTPDVSDDHYYNPPGRMEQLATRYDNAPRNGPKVFVGEYASQSSGTNRQVTPCLDDALGDAAFLTGLERNADVVIMSSYAPLLVNVSNPRGPRNNPNTSMQWQTDLIGYDALNSYGSPSYYVQKMFSLNRGDDVLAAAAQGIPTQQWTPPGRRGGPPGDPVQIPSLFYVATRERQSGTIILKIVNAAETEQKVHVKIDGARSVQSSGDEIVLKGKKRLDTNNLKNPNHIVPVTDRTSGLGKDFTRTFPPLSLTILKISAK